ncbi:hypothetical protein F5888DRAFT_1327218 [Russula emetica]|nr:hypothetical protein F5888DRAFT_1327218 [Russula emetica]
MGHLLPTLELIFAAFRSVAAGRYTIGAAYTVLFYDWIISLDKEVAFIYPGSWNAVKIAYLFCRYYPLVVAPFHFWGLVGNHDEKCLSVVLPRSLRICNAHDVVSAVRLVLVALLTSFLSIVGYVVWVVSKELSLTALFLIDERSGCFATTNQPNAADSLRVIGAYQLGLISVFTAIFDCLNMFIVIWHCVQQRSTLGPLGQSFLKQGVVVYVIMTALNALTIGTYFTSDMLYQAQGSWFAYLLPSALACRLVLLLRRKASPTETELHIQYSHMIGEALEMAAVQRRVADTLDSSIPSLRAEP